MIAPPLAEIGGSQYRVVPSVYPPIDFFEALVPPERLEELYYLESLTNDRLREAVGELARVAPEDRVSGPGASPVMAAFTHIGRPSRFTDGSYGVYYAGRDLKTAIAETAYHRARFLACTQEPPGEIDMRVYVGTVQRPLHDLRGPGFEDLHRPDDYAPSQAAGQALRAQGAWGVVYRSVRLPGGECIAAFRPPAVSIPRQGPHLSYRWDGREIAAVFHKRQVR